MPAAEIDVTADLVRALLAEQHPDLAERRLVVVANGWDNVIVRIGDDLVARLARRAVAAGLVANEHRWLAVLAPRLPLPIPVPVRRGRAGAEYPWYWSICAWFDGDLAADVGLTDPMLEAERLGSFLAALHTEAPADAPRNPYRGIPVRELCDRFADRLAVLAGREDRAAVASGFEALVDTPGWTDPPVWAHGDLHSANIVATAGSISAVIDWGDITAGDPACDLAVAWMLFDAPEREVFRASAGARVPVDDDTWRRGRAWAFYFAVMYLAHSADSERFERMGNALLARLLAEEA